MLYEHFYLVLPFIVEALQVINERYPNVNTFDDTYILGWDPISRVCSIHKCSDKLIVYFWYNIFRRLYPLVGNTKPTKTTPNRLTSECIKYMQNSVEFQGLYKQLKRMTEKRHIEQSISRPVASQMHRTMYLENLVRNIIERV